MRIRLHQNIKRNNGIEISADALNAQGTNSTEHSTDLLCSTSTLYFFLVQIQYTAVCWSLYVKGTY